MPYSAYEISRWFLGRNNIDVKEHDEEVELITHLKLQKLLYYAQGVYLAYTHGARLFNEEILAWEHGPVVREVYHRYSDYGKTGIEFTGDEEDQEILRRIGEDPDASGVLETVFEEYGKYSAWHLRNMTHEERPWKYVWRRQPSGVIPVELIQEYFEQEVLAD